MSISTKPKTARRPTGIDPNSYSSPEEYQVLYRVICKDRVAETRKKLREKRKKKRSEEATPEVREALLDKLSKLKEKLSSFPAGIYGVRRKKFRFKNVLSLKVYSTRKPKTCNIYDDNGKARMMIFSTRKSSPIMDMFFTREIVKKMMSTNVETANYSITLPSVTRTIDMTYAYVVSTDSIKLHFDISDNHSSSLRHTCRFSHQEYLTFLEFLESINTSTEVNLSRNTEVKRCCICGVIKGINEYYRLNKSVENRSGSCVECSKELSVNYVRTNYQSNIEKHRTTAREYARRNKDKLYTKQRIKEIQLMLKTQKS